MKNQVFSMPLFVMLSAVVGCKQSPSPAAKINIQRDTFELSSMQKSQLQKVDCQATATSITCKEVADLKSSQEEGGAQRNLQHKKKMHEARLLVFQELSISLSQEKKKKKSTLGLSNAELLEFSLINLSVNSKASIASIEIEIILEKAANTLIGYECEGRYGKERLNRSFSQEYILDPQANQKEVEDHVVIENNEKKTSPIEVSYWTKGEVFRLRLGNKFKEEFTTDVLSVWMRGGFSVDVSGSPFQAQAQCRQMTGLDRLDKSMQAAVDSKDSEQKILKKTRYKCEMESLIPNKKTKGLAAISGGTAELNLGIDDSADGIFLEMFSDEDPRYDLLKSLRQLGARYFFDIANDKGELTFKVVRIADMATVATVQTKNSSDKIKLSYLNEGHGAQINCSIPKAR